MLFCTLTVIRLKSSLRHIGESAQFRKRVQGGKGALKTDRALLPGQIVTYSLSVAVLAGASLLKMLLPQPVQRQDGTSTPPETRQQDNYCRANPGSLRLIFVEGAEVR